MDTVILGVDEPLGQRSLREVLSAGQDRVVGVGVSSPSSLTAELFKSLPDLRIVSLRDGTFDQAPTGVSVYIGSGSEARMVESLKPQKVLLCTYGIDSYKVYASLVKTQSTILLGDVDSTLVGNVNPGELAGIEYLSPAIRQGLELVKKAAATDRIILVYRADENVEKTPAEKLFALTGKTLSQAGEDTRGAIESALMIRAFFDLAILARVTGKAIDTFGAMIGDPEKTPAVISRDGAFIDAEGNPVTGLTALSYELYPMFYFLTKISSKFKVRGDIAICGASEVAIKACAEDKIDLSSTETVIRQVASAVAHNLKTPTDEIQAQIVFDTAVKAAKSLVDRVVNAREHGTTLVQVRKSKKLNAEREEKVVETKEEHKEHKKATRWKNDPDKKELWAEHVRVRQARQKREAENEKRSKVRMQQVEKAKADRGDFPVEIVADEKKDRDQHNRERTRYGSHSSYRGHSSFGDHRSFGGHRSFHRDGESGERRSFRSAGERKFGGRKSFGDHRSFGDHKSFHRDGESGERKSFRPAGERKFGAHKSFGDHRSFGDHKSFHRDGESGERKSFRPAGERKFGARKSFGNHRSFGGHKSFGGHRGSYDGGKRSFGGRRSSYSRGSSRSSFRKPSTKSEE